MKSTTQYVICSCQHRDHMLILNADKEKDHLYVTLEVHLSPLPFWQRIKRSFLYLIGKRSRYGDFEEIVLDRTNTTYIKDFIDDCLLDEKFL